MPFGIQHAATQARSDAASFANVEALTVLIYNLITFKPYNHKTQKSLRACVAALCVKRQTNSTMVRWHDTVSRHIAAHNKREYCNLID